MSTHFRTVSQYVIQDWPYTSKIKLLKVGAFDAVMSNMPKNAPIDSRAAWRATLDGANGFQFKHILTNARIRHYKSERYIPNHRNRQY